MSERRLCPTCCKNMLLCMFGDSPLCMERRNLRGIKATHRPVRSDSQEKRDGQLKRKYGIGFGAYTRLYEKQGGKCAICETEKPLIPGAKVPFHVDHDHATGKVRGLLCAPCNLGIGMLKDKIESFDNAKAYLLRAAGG